MRNEDWKPDCEVALLKQRAELLRRIREFMQQRDVLEVETPVISSARNPDPNIDSFSIKDDVNGTVTPRYLQTSPEFPMKRLLAAGSGSIYQICKVFRQAETGSQHNPEFSMLEWYRVGFDYHDLMHEINELLQLLGLPAAELKSYQQLFRESLNINPHSCSLNELQQAAAAKGLEVQDQNRNSYLDFLYSHLILTSLKDSGPLFIKDFPASQAALATVRGEEACTVAERFELIIQGMEIANGYNELTDANACRQRQLQEQQLTAKRINEQFPVDEKFIQASGMMPKCAGVALGIDRLLMLLSNEQHIDRVLSFSWRNA